MKLLSTKKLEELKYLIVLNVKFLDWFFIVISNRKKAFVSLFQLTFKGEALRQSLQQLCANVLGHLNSKGLYPSLKVCAEVKIISVWNDFRHNYLICIVLYWELWVVYMGQRKSMLNFLWKLNSVKDFFIWPALSLATVWLSLVD